MNHNQAAIGFPAVRSFTGRTIQTFSGSIDPLVAI
jgi:hypothetical protein